MKKILAIILFLLSCLPVYSLSVHTVLKGGLEIPVAIFYHFIPATALLYVVFRLFNGYPLFDRGHRSGSTNHKSSEGYDSRLDEREWHHEKEQGEPEQKEEKKLQISCSGCGAKIHVSIHSTSSCEYCGTMIHA
ncbi:hypothetical protein N6H13_22000 [Paenibacillus sp. CC-CFT742]|nr:hypothetical protein [Paenibacillus sp. CC-CFT742]WJH27828.1 hypothetical protein N6H13_22000 [Paenibacillus sp. CC-CFT742]